MIEPQNIYIVEIHNKLMIRIYMVEPFCTPRYHTELFICCNYPVDYNQSNMEQFNFIRFMLSSLDCCDVDRLELREYFCHN